MWSVGCAVGVLDVEWSVGVWVKWSMNVECGLLWSGVGECGVEWGNVEWDVLLEW